VSKWEKVKLGDIGVFKTGGTPSRKCPDYFKGNIPWITTVSLNKNFIDESDAIQFITREAIENSAAKIISANSIMIGVRVGIGKVSINKVPMATNQDIVSIEDIDERKIYKPYLVYFIKSKNHLLDTLKRGATIQGININVLKSLTIPLPPLETQKQIAKILDTATELLALQKQQLAELDNLLKSIFYDMFGVPSSNEKGWEKGWEIKPLRLVGETDLTYGSGAAATNYDGHTRYIRITDINEDGTLGNEFVSPNKVSEKYYLNDGDILFARSGATVGKTFRFRKEFGKCIYAGYLIKFVPDKTQVLPDYVFYFTKTNYYKNFIESNKKTVAQPNINARQLSNLKIPVPPLHLQNQFADIVTKIEEQKSQVRKAIEETQTLFDSLMSQYFDE